MAKRRGWSKGARLAYGLGTGAQQVFQQLLRDQMAARSQERTADMQEQRDMRTLARQEKMLQAGQRAESRQKLIEKLPDVAKASGDALSPETFMSMMLAGGTDLMPSSYDEDYAGTGEPQYERAANLDATAQMLEGLRAPLRKRLETSVGEGIDKATTPEALDINSVLGQVRGADDRVDAMSLPREALTDPLDPEQQTLALPADAQEYVRRAQSKAQALRSKPGEPLTIKNPDGSKSVIAPSAADFAQGPIQVEPDAVTQGTLEGQQAVAKETAVLDPAFQELKTRTEARMANIAEALTRQAKITTAAGIAGAQTRARLDAELDPEVVGKEIDKAQRMAASSTQSTESERRAAANWTPLVNAHANALQRETAGQVLTPGAIEITGSTWLNPIFGGMVDPGTAEYAQAARDFVSTLGYIRSGVQVRMDEVDKFLATMFAFEGDGPVQIKQKQQSREILLGAMQAMVGRSAPEAARVLSAAINNGQIPASILGSIEIRPEISTHMLPQLQGTPVMDVDGRLIGVRR